ncbi:hypothetical protein Smar_0034 [Staphylothermus marinus F1]|uniref:Uncharacterized protein n=1 Tax=Staphylothermus marinus (strain ATCC 43588 / DSM 3639 / JCM 9404 / F1) TaxID=399550 RepID=A3DKI7_STAMF|nr:hypothetical protein [Staphylothermus marinus]ABN69147.1 hypothetical protein Smar_0034 [Staphylothermus marinus F1]
MIARIGRKIIVLQEAPTHWDIRYALEDVNHILLTKEYKPIYFFEGTPAIGQGGFSVIVKLDREMKDEERRILKRLLSNRGIKVIMED